MTGNFASLPEPRQLCWVQPEDGRLVACDRVKDHKGRHSWEFDADRMQPTPDWPITNQKRHPPTAEAEAWYRFGAHDEHALEIEGINDRVLGLLEYIKSLARLNPELEEAEILRLTVGLYKGEMLRRRYRT